MLITQEINTTISKNSNNSYQNIKRNLPKIEAPNPHAYSSAEEFVAIFTIELFVGVVVLKKLDLSISLTSKRELST